MKISYIAGVCLLALAALPAQATVTGLFNTGVDDDGVALANGASRGDTDPHYTYMFVDPAPTALSIFTDPAVLYYNSAYAPESSTSRWVSVNGQGGADEPDTYSNVTVAFHLNFDISDIAPDLVTITGQWATDDRGLDILVNGLSTGNTVSGFNSLRNFTLDQHFIAGANTLDFIMRDDLTPLAFRVEGITATESAPLAAVPEPASWAMMVGGFGLVGGALRRRSRITSKLA